MSLPLAPPYPPMEAQLVERLPEGNDWQYEPKWDGFRCLVFRDGGTVWLQSKSGQPLARYFPELVEGAARLHPTQFVLDGEIVVPVEGKLSFDDLLQRIHPAASRVQRLAREHPATVVAFDLLLTPEGRLLTPAPLRERRRALETFAVSAFSAGPMFRLSPVARDLAEARRWLEGAGGAVDGVIAKRTDLPYRSGDRSGMQKVKRIRTADCVVAGFRYAAAARVVGSLLLGLYGEDGLLHHVGFTSGFNQQARRTLLTKLRPLLGGPGFTGRTPGGPSRWNPAGAAEFEPLTPRLVVEVGYDHFTGGRFRHGTRLLRWRPDKAPAQCTLAQVEAESRVPFLHLLEAAPQRAPRERRRA
jgi:ATP-dependent DNA ligase